MNHSKSWRNIFPATCLPLTADYGINEPELRAYVRWLADFDLIDGLVCNGHTGEISSLRPEERAQVTAIIADEVGDRVTVVSGSAPRAPWRRSTTPAPPRKPAPTASW